MNFKNLNKEWLEQKYVKEKLSCSSIGVLLGVSGERIRRKIKSFLIPINDRIYNRNVYLCDKEWLVKHYIHDKLSINEIARLAKCNYGGAKSALERFSIPRRSKSEGLICKRKGDGLAINEQSIEVIIGSLLGDASVCRDKKNGIPLGNPFFTKTNIHKDHVHLVAQNIFSVNWADRVFYVKPKKFGKYFSQKSYCVRSLRTKDLWDLYKKWYIEKAHGVSFKIVPRDIKITPIVLLHWFMDDGYSSFWHKKYKNKKHNKHKILVELCTDNFIEKDVDFLVQKLYDDLRIRAYKRKRKKRKSDGQTSFSITISELDTEKFFEIIGESPCKSMEYKWKTIRKEQ